MKRFQWVFACVSDVFLLLQNGTILTPLVMLLYWVYRLLLIANKRILSRMICGWSTATRIAQYASNDRDERNIMRFCNALDAPITELCNFENALWTSLSDCAGSYVTAMCLRREAMAVFIILWHNRVVVGQRQAGLDGFIVKWCCFLNVQNTSLVNKMCLSLN